MALKESNSNEKPSTGAVAIPIVLAIDARLSTLAYRISVEKLMQRSSSHQCYGLIMNPLKHSSTVASGSRCQERRHRTTILR